MALNKDVLGTALYNAANDFNDKEPVEDVEANRLAYWKVIADEIIKHIKLGQVTVAVTTTGTAAAQTGTGTGTIN